MYDRYFEMFLGWLVPLYADQSCSYLADVTNKAAVLAAAACAAREEHTPKLDPSQEIGRPPAPKEF